MDMVEYGRGSGKQVMANFRQWLVCNGFSLLKTGHPEEVYNKEFKIDNISVSLRISLSGFFNPIKFQLIIKGYIMFELFYSTDFLFFSNRFDLIIIDFIKKSLGSFYESVIRKSIGK